MSKQRYQEQADGYMSLIKFYMSLGKLDPDFTSLIERAVHDYARQQVYLAFARQAEALARIEQEFYPHEEIDEELHNA